MNLHHDHEAFSELIAAASNELRIPPGIIEKDYYVTFALKELASRVKGMVFKGGTSLTKCYQILDRFSEDIDISYAAAEGVPGESRKRQLKKAVVSSVEAIGLSVTNLEETRSRRSYNCYKAGYSSIYSPLLELKPELIIETYIALLSFPTIKRMTDNYIYRFLKMTEREDLAEKFDLMPFEITTQAIERTLIDKMFAICDYYLSDKIDQHSRHLYDIYKILEYNTPDASLSKHVREVRGLRESLSVCPSAKTGVCINDLLEEIVDKEIYRDDYETVTRRFLFTYLPYETAIGGIKEIISRGYFRNL